MPLETGTFISDLVATNPTGTDSKSEGDNHLRLIKSTIKATFPNIAGAVTRTHTQLNNALDKTGDTMTGPLAQAAGTAALPSYTFSGDVNTGMWSPAADVLAWSTGGSERLRVDSSGNVGVGTNSPAAGLDVRNGNIRVGGAAAGKFLGFSASNTQVLDLGVSTGTGSGSDVGFYNLISGNLVFGTTSAERMRIDSGGNVLVTGSGGLGYGTGSGGTVTQATSKATAVTLNKPSGRITMNNATLNAGTSVVFTLNNTTIATTDLLVLSTRVFGASYRVEVEGVISGGATIRVTNITGGSLSDAIEIQFAVVKGAIS